MGIFGFATILRWACAHFPYEKGSLASPQSFLQMQFALSPLMYAALLIELRL